MSVGLVVPIVHAFFAFLVLEIAVNSGICRRCPGIRKYFIKVFD